MNAMESAVIGFWRQGATIEEIYGATGLYWKVIERIIKQYKTLIK